MPSACARQAHTPDKHAVHAVRHRDVQAAETVVAMSGEVRALAEPPVLEVMPDVLAGRWGEGGVSAHHQRGAMVHAVVRIIVIILVLALVLGFFKFPIVKLVRDEYHSLVQAISAR